MVESLDVYLQAGDKGEYKCIKGHRLANQNDNQMKTTLVDCKAKHLGSYWDRIPSCERKLSQSDIYLSRNSR